MVRIDGERASRPRGTGERRPMLKLPEQPEGKDGARAARGCVEKKPR